MLCMRVLSDYSAVGSCIASCNTSCKACIYAIASCNAYNKACIFEAYMYGLV